MLYNPDIVLFQLNDAGEEVGTHFLSSKDICKIEVNKKPVWIKKSKEAERKN